MFGAKKKHYSEVSESKKNINSDYYNIFENEFKKMFSDNTIIKDIIKSNNNDVVKKKIELDDKDIFFINLFSNYVKNK